MKCWGRNDYGQLGYGDKVARGASLSQMGTSLPFVDLGSALNGKVQKITLGLDFTCAWTAVSYTFKCWGKNLLGQLGQGDTKARGDDAFEMGDALLAVSLGTPALDVNVGGEHGCARLTDGTAKCWGANALGQLGLGDAVPRGTTSGQMGTSLPVINYGSGMLGPVLVGGAQTCVQLLTLEVRCWGNNDFGQLGRGDAVSRGMVPADMGANLVNINLAATIDKVVMGNTHACALLAGKVKCWGDNRSGQLGLGDTVIRGDNPSEMGLSLAYVDVGL